MELFFQNTYEDSNKPLAIEKSEITQHIDEYVNKISKRLTPTSNHVAGGLYVGITGIAYMYYYLAMNPALSKNKAMYLKKGLEYIQPALDSSAGESTSFLLGDAGTYAVATALFKEVGDERYEDILKQYTSLYNSYLNPKFLKCGGDELFVGRSGYVAGVLWLTREIKSNVIQWTNLYKICDIIVANGKDYSKKHNSPCPLMYHYYSTEYLGAAHGVSFILQMLMSVPGYLEHNKAAALDIKVTAKFLVSLQTDEGNWPTSMERIGLSDHKVQWCHGAPGVLYLMAKSYLLYKDQQFLDASLKAGEIAWHEGLLRKGPGICHGVAGNGYAFLLLYRLTGEVKYLNRAKLFADFLNNEEFLRDARTPDNPESLYEGIAGTVCFLSDLLLPNKAEFPFMDVFSTYV